jgi:hypothetical protein
MGLIDWLKVFDGFGVMNGLHEYRFIGSWMDWIGCQYCIKWLNRID